MFSSSRTQFYSLKGEVTARNGALMRTGPAQLDDPSQANSADERGARNIKPTNIRVKVIFHNCFIAVRYQGLFCGEERSLKHISLNSLKKVDR